MFVVCDYVRFRLDLFQFTRERIVPWLSGTCGTTCPNARGANLRFGCVNTTFRAALRQKRDANHRCQQHDTSWQSDVSWKPGANSVFHGVAITFVTVAVQTVPSRWLVTAMPM